MITVSCVMLCFLNALSYSCAQFGVVFCALYDFSSCFLSVLCGFYVHGATLSFQGGICMCCGCRSAWGSERGGGRIYSECLGELRRAQLWDHMNAWILNVPTDNDKTETASGLKDGYFKKAWRGREGNGNKQKATFHKQTLSSTHRLFRTNCDGQQQKQAKEISL